MSKKNRFVLLLFTISIMFSVFHVCSNAETVVPYSSVDDSSSAANVLADLMVNDTNYGPYYQYVIVRTGEQEYKAYFGKKLSAECTCIRYVPATYGSPAVISKYSVNQVNVQQNGYVYIGNTSGSARSVTAMEHNFLDIVPILLIIVVILLALRIFRKRFRTSIRGYSV